MAGEIEYYKEQLDHGRHIEVQRSTIAGLALTISGAIIGKILDRGITHDQLPYVGALFAINSVALLISVKLYERFRLHNEVARLVRNSINPILGGFRQLAEGTIRSKYPFVFRLRLHLIWNGMFGSLALVALVIIWLAYHNQPSVPAPI